MLPPGDLWQYLETFWLSQLGDVTGFRGVEASDVAHSLQCTGQTHSSSSNLAQSASSAHCCD